MAHREKANSPSRRWEMWIHVSDWVISWPWLWMCALWSPWPHLAGVDQWDFTKASTVEAPSRSLKCTKGKHGRSSLHWALTISYFMHRPFNKRRQHPRPAPILPARETKLFPLLSLPPLIPSFTSSALRKFDCNLGLDKILLLQKVPATW